MIPFHSMKLSSLILGIVVLSSMASAVTAQTNTSFKTAWPTNDYWRPLEIDPDIYIDNPFRIGLFKPLNGEDHERLWSQTKSVFFYGLGVVGVLAALPESATGWDPDTDILSKWQQNVRDGPVWDRDNWAYNYIGHTYCGGVYYQVARKSGYRQWDAFMYSLLMSTFYWEYGVEAFAETPSIQDLVVTPVMGWVYGEWAYQTEKNIRDSNNEVLDSKILGGVSLFFLDPIDAFGRTVNRIVGRPWIKAGYGYFTYTTAPVDDDMDHTVMLNMSIPVGMPSGPAGPSEEEVVRYDLRDDPVDTGLVGLSVGTGMVILDDRWGVDDLFYTKYSLGLYFTPRFSTRLAYAQGDGKEIASGQKISYENYSFDAQYYFNTEHRLRPYVTGGVGEQMWDESNSSKNLELNVGIGLHWQFHPKWALHSDLINYYNSSAETHDQNVSASVIYRFGDGEH